MVTSSVGLGDKLSLIFMVQGMEDENILNPLKIVITNIFWVTYGHLFLFFKAYLIRFKFKLINYY